MRPGSVHTVFFSATGTTRKVMTALSGAFSGTAIMHDLLYTPLERELLLGPEDLLLAGVPVYSGRVPDLCLQSLKKLKGGNTPAVAVVVYGNRDYDDALLELKNTLETGGFLVAGAAAFIARHAIFPEVAPDRPDEEDMRRINEFGH